MWKQEETNGSMLVVKVRDRVSCVWIIFSRYLTLKRKKDFIGHVYDSRCLIKASKLIPDAYFLRGLILGEIIL